MAVWFGMLFLRFLFVSFRYVHRTRGTFFSSLLCAVGICTLCGCVLSAIYQWWNLLSHALPSYIFVYVACEKSRLAFRSSRAFPQIPKIHIYIAHFFVHIILAIRPYVRVCMMWHMLGYLYDYIYKYVVRSPSPFLFLLESNKQKDQKRMWRERSQNNRSKIHTFLGLYVQKRTGRESTERKMRENAYACILEVNVCVPLLFVFPPQSCGAFVCCLDFFVCFPLCVQR